MGNKNVRGGKLNAAAKSTEASPTKNATPSTTTVATSPLKSAHRGANLVTVVVPTLSLVQKSIAQHHANSNLNLNNDKSVNVAFQAHGVSSSPTSQRPTSKPQNIAPQAPSQVSKHFPVSSLLFPSSSDKSRKKSLQVQQLTSMAKSMSIPTQPRAMAEVASHTQRFAQKNTNFRKARKNRNQNYRNNQDGGNNPNSTVSEKSPQGSHLQKLDFDRKDVIIDSSSVTYNIVRKVTKYLPDSNLPYYINTDEFNATNYDFLKDLESRSKEDRQQFWSENHVEINVDLRDWNKPELKSIYSEGKKTVLDTIDTLGPDFPAFATHLLINLMFANPPSKGGFITGSVNDTIFHDMPAKPTTRASTTGQKILSIPSVQHLLALTDKLQTFQSIKLMYVTLQTPPGSGPQPTPTIPIDCLNHTLAFYPLWFTKWRLSWIQSEWMSGPNPVLGWPLGHLEVEARKIHEEIQKEADEKKKAVDDAVFVRMSAFVPLK